MKLSSGAIAELAAAQYLLQRGHKIIERNWRRPYAEIDIISSYKNYIYFTEVKYRKNNFAGDGADYVTVKKLARMHRAVQGWMTENQTVTQQPVCLAVISVGGPDFIVIDYFDDIS